MEPEISNSSAAAYGSADVADEAAPLDVKPLWWNSLVALPPDNELAYAESLEGPQCWGGSLKGDNGAGCDVTFRRGRRHMKNKFCGNCNGQKGHFFIPASRIRGIPV